ncbi:hypothetical protein BST92_12615 [Nonlabens arenilitoris]|uniref:Uncharacterized protein n=1 Tax=Nonlabens arenilitoris TaxID=1217969 RepID=A0A2S7UES6_9FLAO|nr:hypothetical protein [Nonlabens arenilitoris]PQJ32712.1 hypothetical protein BST92_12615 [Nonlabens arenilitoris]
MSILKGRKSSVLYFDTEKELLIIEDHLRSYRVMQLVLLFTCVISCSLILVKEDLSFWFGFMIGAFIALALCAAYYYAFRTSVVKNIPFNDIESIISSTLFLKNDRRLTIKLKDNRFRNIITMDQLEIDRLFNSFKEVDIVVEKRTSFSLLPLNF